jgi:predicted nucleic acid-binding protein
LNRSLEERADKEAPPLIRTLIPGPLTENALAFLNAMGQEYSTLVAPALLAFEVTSTLRRLVYLEEITLAEGEEAFERFLRIDINLSQQRSIFPLAWHLAKRFNLSRAYDTAYLALAHLRNCEFWTADERLYKAVSHELDWVKWLGDYFDNVTLGSKT